MIKSTSLIGNVKSSVNNDLVNAKIYLLEYDANADSIYVVDSVFSNNLGSYTFLNVGLNKYIKAIPNIPLFPQEIHTYFNGSAVFQFATR